MNQTNRRIRVRGARTHNLRSIDVDIPVGRFVALTGPSGSGKSSLAFDTIHAESTRRLAAVSEGLSETTATTRPEVDSIEGLGVAIGVSQRSFVRSIRSTVATMAGVADPMRRLFATRARPVCSNCGGLGVGHDVREATGIALGLGEGARIVVLAPVAVAAKIADGSAVLDSLARAGFVRARIDGAVVELAETRRLDPKKPHTIEAIVDRFVVRAAEPDRAREAIELAYRTSGGTAVLETGDDSSRTVSRDPRCDRCGLPVARLEKGAFRRLDPASACERCRGSGLVTSESKGKAKRKSPRVDDDELAPTSDGVCAACEGLGVRPAALDARALGVSFRDAHAMPVFDLAARLGGERDDPLVHAIVRSLGFLAEVGLGHLSLGRRSSTLSTGEASRVRLASPFANALVDVVYVLDEPTAGLHPRERPAIVAAMRWLVDADNTVICVEHDAAVILAADHVIELGPGRGPEGGRIVATGRFADLSSETLSHRIVDHRVVPKSKESPTPRARGSIAIASVAPFGDLSIDFPLARVTCIAGPSGSGKSTLLGLLASLGAAVDATRGGRVAFSGFESIRRVVRFDDTSSTPGPRSLVATRLGIFGAIRETYASLPEARTRGFDAARFGLTSPGGRCEVCEGRGTVTVATSSFAFETACDRCGGSRYDDVVSAIRYRGASIVDLFAEPLVDARRRFEAIAAIERPLAHAIALGLGHLTLGRAASQLSGGEGTRVRLAAELARATAEGTLYLLDEPCRGLAVTDVVEVTDALEELAHARGTVVIAEHTVAAIARADHVVDLDRGADGRTLVAASGSAHAIARTSSPTSSYLAAAFAPANGGRGERC